MNIEIKEFIFDTVVAAYLIDSAKSNYPLETLINEYLMKEVKGEGEELICNAHFKYERTLRIFKRKNR